MGIYRSSNRRYQARQAARKSLEKRQAISHNKIIAEIKALILDLNQEQLNDIYKVLMKLMNNETITVVFLELLLVLSISKIVLSSYVLVSCGRITLGIFWG
ncbi:7793_t:CDS:2, partial [Dentiscutata heterogama]